jgi:ABC-type amino acid transport substrate-binding protein
LQAQFGPQRVIDTPISEAAIMGGGVGMALAGLRPVVEMRVVDFALCAIDEIVNQAAKNRFMFGGQGRVPLVARMPIGIWSASAAQHSQSLEAWFAHIPGLVVATPATPQDNYGMGFELGREFARYLGLAFEPIVFQKNGDVLAAAKQGAIDLALVNATPARAEYLDFAQAILFSAQSYLIGAHCAVRDMATLDRKGIVVGVSGGSTSETVLPTLLQYAKVVAINSLNEVTQQLNQAKIDAFGTNKGILFELAKHSPGSIVLEGAWGFERIALGIPKARSAGMPLLQAFCSAIQANGFLEAAAQRAGMQGVSFSESVPT